MYNKIFSLCVLGSGIIAAESLSAHSHHTYIVEQAPTVVVVQQPAVIVQQPVMIVEQEEGPPEDQVEVISACPGPDYMWTKGNWQWNGRWMWVGGNWQRRPYEGAVYVPGYWKKSHHHWEYAEAHWRR